METGFPPASRSKLLEFLVTFMIFELIQSKIIVDLMSIAPKKRARNFPHGLDALAGSTGRTGSLA